VTSVIRHQWPNEIPKKSVAQGRARQPRGPLLTSQPRCPVAKPVSGRRKTWAYPSHFALTDRKQILQALEEIAFQARCAIVLKDNTFYLRYLPAEPTPAGTIAESDIEAGTLELLHTTTEDLVTKLVARWRATGAQEEDNKVILRHNVKKYGTKEREFDFYIYNKLDMVLKSATFWLIRYSNTWKKVRFSTPLHKLNLETFDAVTLDFDSPYIANSDVLALPVELNSVVCGSPNQGQKGTTGSGSDNALGAGIGSMGAFRLHLDRLDFGEEPAGVLGEEGGHDAEHGVTEAADVQHVAPIRGLGRGVRLQVDADQFRPGPAPIVQPDLVGSERLPLGHHARRAVPASADRAMVVTDHQPGEFTACVTSRWPRPAAARSWCRSHSGPPGAGPGFSLGRRRS